jgi:hypothetical protein
MLMFALLALAAALLSFGLGVRVGYKRGIDYATQTLRAEQAKRRAA